MRVSASVGPSAIHPRCKTCQSPDLEVVNAALAGGAPAEAVARAHGLPPRSVLRHADAHLPVALAKAQSAADVAHGDRLLADLEDLQRRTLSILSKAEGLGDPIIALRAIREARGNLELMARIMGELDERPSFNVALSAEWLEVRGVILAALEPYPDARAEVSRRLTQLPATAAEFRARD